MADEAVRELSGKLGLDTTDFKTAIVGANRELRVLESGFRASVATLGDWSKSSTGLEARIKSLTSQIDIQKAKVAALDAEYQKVAAEKGVNSRAAQELEIKLNKETETLGKMNTELVKDQQALVGLSKESQVAAKASTDLAKSEEQASTKSNTLRNSLDALRQKTAEVSREMQHFSQNVIKGVGLAVAGVAAGIAAAAGVIGLAAFNIAKNSAPIQGLRLAFEGLARGIGRGADEILSAMQKASAGMVTNADLMRSFNMAAQLVSIDFAQKLPDAMKYLGKVSQATGQDMGFLLDSLVRGVGRVSPMILDNLGIQIDLAEVTEYAAKKFGVQADALTKTQQQAALMDVVLQKLATNTASMPDVVGSATASFASFGTLFKNFRDEIGVKLLPIFTTLMDRIQELGKVIFPLIVDILGDLVKGNIDNVITKLGSLAATILQFFGVSRTKALSFAISLINTIKAIATGIKSTVAGIQEGLAPIIAFIRDQLIPVFLNFITTQLIPFIQQHGPAIKGALIAIGAAMVAFGVVIPIVTGLIAALTSPVTLVIAAIALLGAAWATNWGGIQDKARAVWAFLQPILLQIWTWLQTNIPIALQTLSNFWTNVLLPAIQRVGSFISTNVIPVLQTIWNWLSTNIPTALQTLSTFWTETLLPAIQTVWEWINSNLVPLFTALGELINTVLIVAVTAFAGLWEKVLYPALEKVWKGVSEFLQPILEEIGKFIEETLAPAINGFVKNTIEKWKKAFDDIEQAIGWVIEQINNLIEILKNLKLPDWLTPGSPTPFEMGLRGIANATKEATKSQQSLYQTMKDFEQLGSKLNLALGGESPAGGFGSTTLNQYITANSPLDYEKIALRVTEIQQRRAR